MGRGTGKDIDMDEKPSKLTSIKKIAALQMSFLGLLLQTCLYAWVWFQMYYPLVRLKLKFYQRGHALILIIYLLLLVFFSRTWEGNNVGYSKPFDVILSQIFTLFTADFISYFQISLMRNWIVPVWPMLRTFLLQMLVAIVWVYLSDFVYRRVFPPRRMLFIHGDRPSADMLAKFATHPERYRITGSFSAGQGAEAVIRAIEEENYRTVVLWEVPTPERNELIKYCYGHGVRMYVLPKIPDVLMNGSTQIHVVDTTLYLTKEYALTFGQRFWKRTIDLVCAAILLVVTSPIFLVTAICVKAYDRGPVFYKQVRCTKDMKEFHIIKFRSMKVNAESDGKARLASKEDARITPVGRFIRKCRIDELPQLINILRGEMSFIGPRPERPEIIRQYLGEMPEFAFRTRVKAGLAGYAQVYGRYNTTPYDKLKLDLTYIQHYSVGLDLKLMLLTLKILVQPESTEGVADGQTTALKEHESDRQ